MCRGAGGERERRVKVHSDASLMLCFVHPYEGKRSE